MRSGTKAGPVPVGKITKRLPVGGHKHGGLGGVVRRLPGGLPRGKALGATGGVLLGAGAAVAARRALGHRNGRDDEPEQDTTAPEAEKAEADSAKPAEKPKGLFGRLKDTVGGLLKRGGGKGGDGKKVKLTSIVEHTDVGAPRRLVYDQFTQFQEFPSFMKKVISVDQADDAKLNWQARIFWSKRTWEATIVEQVPDEHIVWRSKGAKGHVDGTISFHELTPNLTRVLVVLEYHPQGLFERTGNIWRAQGRRVRLELKHFRRHVMTRSLTHRDEIEGWRGEIRDSEVVRTHEEALKAEDAGSGQKAKRDSGAKSSRSAKNNAKVKEYEESSR
ncbi:SRPBCC family protein [Actinomadura oligospora]|uniref:SRPBCC family protein n=1 Tax=Actinomadura oligospora TaxID=111804 RepID=UPI000A0034DF|nr:SRPBCC family protein [Actinomadura oligospora]